MRKIEVKRKMRAIEKPRHTLVILLSHVQDPVNVGSVFRIAEAANVSELILAGTTTTPPHKLITKIGRAKDRNVPWRYVEDATTALYQLSDEGFTNFAVEITEESTPYYECAFPEKTCLVVGNEDHGLPKKQSRLCDEQIFIPMHGKGASLNVHVAVGIVAFGVLHGARFGVGTTGRLD